MASPAPIPTPSAHRWRDIRMAYLPLITFALLLVTIFWMWRSYVHPPYLVGEVEAVRADVISIVDGTVLELKTDNLQEVTNGQELAVISVMEPAIVQAERKRIEADLELMKARMAVDMDRNTENYQQLRFQFLNYKVQLTIDQTNLDLAEVEFKRAEQLFTNATLLVSEEAYDIAKAKRDVLRATVSGKSIFLAEYEKTLATLDPEQLPRNVEVISNAIQAQLELLALRQKPLVLKAPIDGFISAINHRPGEKITAGLPILVVSGNKTDRVVGWVRQPVRVKPSIGDMVEVRTIRSGLHTIEGTVTAVGEQLEAVSPAALPFGIPPKSVEYGLQFLVDVPPGNDLLPGEMVELTLTKKSSR
jgi:multidrug resistance efflux pump